MSMHKYTLPAESNEMLTTRQWDPKHTILSKWYNSKYKCIFAKILSTNLFKNIIFITCINGTKYSVLFG